MISPSLLHRKQTVFPGKKKLPDKILEATTMGFGTDRKQVWVKVALLAKQLKIKIPFKNGIPGKDWVHGFIKHHTISLRCQTPLSTIRGHILNKTVTAKYFNDLNTVMKSLDGLIMSPCNIVYLCEFSCSYWIPKLTLDLKQHRVSKG